MADKLQADPVFRPYWSDLQAWLRFESEPDRSRLASDLESDDERRFYSAAFELFLTQWFASRNWPFERHPDLPGIDTHPDYLVRHPTGPFIVEAKVALESDRERVQRKLREELRDRLDEVTGPFEIIMTLDGTVPGGFRARNVSDWLRTQLATLHIAEGEAENIVYQDEGFSIAFDVLPGEGDDPVISAEMLTGSVAKDVRTHEALASAIRSKALRYGVPPYPYVVAVQPNLELPVEAFSLTTALYGTIRWHLRDRGRAESIEFLGETHSRDGIFTGTDGEGVPLRTRVSAAAVYRRTFRSGEGTIHDFVICHHPSAARPLNVEVFADTAQLLPAEADDGDVRLRWTNDPPPPDWAKR